MNWKPKQNDLNIQNWIRTLQCLADMYITIHKTKFKTFTGTFPCK